ncbi:MAG: nucleotidyl transferase AbiEii/AbiGii toxin family protein [bacterium]|nr:nucleotidyl transferase AbiEii/AbiGii toxin family protein [bacterium]
MPMHYEALDEKRRALLSALGAFKSDFYLAGGTALALQIGHRVSVDFDFFTEKDFDTEELYERVQKVFGEVARTQESPNTLAIIVQEDVRISFMKYRYPLLGACVETEHLRLSSIPDIGCMKLGAIVSRSELKDYVDLFFILKHLSLTALLVKLAEKIPSLDQNLVLKAIISFDDVTMEPIDFIKGNEVTFDKIRESIIESVRSVPLGIR